MLRPIQEIQGLCLFEAKQFPDERGYLLQSYVRSDLAARGVEAEFRQALQSRSRRGVVRGMHFQWDPPMGKLIRCVAGRIFDVAIDLRRDSPTLGDHSFAEMSEENRYVFWLPAGFAHGFMALEENTVVLYECTVEWSSQGEGGILWDDPRIGVKWPALEPLLSAKDRVAMTFEQWLAHPASRSFAMPRAETPQPHFP